MEVAANGGRQLSRVLARVVIDGCTREEGGIVCCGIVGPSWKSQPVRVRRYRGPGSALPSAIPPYINSGSNGFFPSVVGRRGEVLLYRGYPHRDIERVYTPPRLSFMIHLPPPLYNNARPPPSFVIYASLNFEPSFFSFFLDVFSNLFFSTKFYGPRRVFFSSSLITSSQFYSRRAFSLWQKIERFPMKKRSKQERNHAR